MLENIKNEMKKFIDDMRENIKDPTLLEYMMTRTEKLYDVVFDELENYVEGEEERLKKIIENQQIQNERINKMEASVHSLNKNIDNIYDDIYEDNMREFEIICPYCNFIFDTNIDETNTEIICPECNNTIELDWGREDENTGNNHKNDGLGTNKNS